MISRFHDHDKGAVYTWHIRRLPFKKNRAHLAWLVGTLEATARFHDHDKGAVVIEVKLPLYRGHKAGGKLQPTPAMALEGLVFENSKGGSRKRLLRPLGASYRNAALC
jgi:hypothetical protein